MKADILKHPVLAAALMLAAAPSYAAGLQFAGTSHKVIEITPDAATGLEAIYVLYGADGVSASYAYSGTAPQWSEYSNMGGGYAQPVEGVVSQGGISTLSALKGDMGYIIDDGQRQHCFWIVDYSKHRFAPVSITPASEQPCESTVLNLEGIGSPIYYYSIDGRRRVLSRDIMLHYRTEEWNEEAGVYDQTDKTGTFESFEGYWSVMPPIYCRTILTVTGDRFLEEWGEGIEIESNTFFPNAVAVHTTAEQPNPQGDDEDYKSNKITSGTDGLGGSAPADIEFRAQCTEATVHFEWQFARDPEFDDITHRITERDLDYTFTEEGITYVRFIGSNADGSCEQEGDTYTVSIASSELKCPNAFSPGVSEGVNDEWKVSYRSLIEFECWIFDRYGNQLAHFTDPEQGWDGRRGGKIVSPGVYYYVIQAKGADGKKYKKSGDINIIGYKTFSNPAVQE